MADTVSKVLKLKEKYLHLDDGSRTPIKRSKGKIPDIERAVSNWAKKHQRQVLPLSNESIRDKAWMFATTVGSSDCVVKVNNPNRLEKFKQKNGLQGASLPDSSENEDLDMIQPFDPVSGDQAPNAISLMLPAGDRSASAENDVLKDAKGNNHKDFSFQGIHSESNDYFGSYFIDGNITPTFPPAIRSPSLRSQPLRLSKPAPADARPRYITPPTSATAEPVPNAQLFQHSMTFPTLSSQDRTLNIDSEVPYYKHNSISPSIMAPPPNPSSVPPPYSSPSKDEARRALEVVMAFFQSQPVPMDHAGVSQPQLLQILGHRKIETFQKHYQSTDVVVDVQATFLGSTSKSDMIKEIGKLCLRQDPKLPRSLTMDQKLQARNQPDSQQLERRRDALTQ
ncbi:MAG: hypothetical protein L6R38_003624 [Xanthoria sp. 2 TBL-2021]|nr:MAG: hypothetical protein L6R38_003624 [Xanthoria sp. 2 TBL-2021]